MTVIKKKGEWQFGYRDTFSLDMSLGPIIYAGLKKFHEVLSERSASGKSYGIPQEYAVEPFENWDVNKNQWLSDIEKMMYAFNPKSEPDIMDYDFDFPNFMKEGSDAVDFTCSNEAERNRYHEDCKIHQQKVEEGLKLFGEKYQDLWW